MESSKCFGHLVIIESWPISLLWTVKPRQRRGIRDRSWGALFNIAHYQLLSGLSTVTPWVRRRRRRLLYPTLWAAGEKLFSAPIPSPTPAHFYYFWWPRRSDVKTGGKFQMPEWRGGRRGRAGDWSVSKPQGGASATVQFSRVAEWGCHRQPLHHLHLQKPSSSADGSPLTTPSVSPLTRHVWLACLSCTLSLLDFTQFLT